MYVEGTCTGMFELLEVIKTTAISAGWKVVGEKEVLYNDIPRDAKYCIPDGDIYSIKANKTTPSRSSFRVIMPRGFKPFSLSYEKNSQNKGVTLYGVLFDQTRELIFKENLESNAAIPVPFNEKEYIQIEAIPNGGEIYDFHLNLQSSSPILEKEIFLHNNDDVNNVFLNFKAFIEHIDKTNLMFGTSTGYSPDFSVEKQINTKIGYLYGDDKEMEYKISINNSRIVIILKIHHPGDVDQKNEVWQFAYLGRIRIYGGEWALPDCNAVICSGFESLRWSEFAKANIQKPFLNAGGNFIEILSTAFSSPTQNPQNCNIVAPPNKSIFSMPIICYDNSNIYGELDGVINVVSPDGVNNGDEISIDDKPYTVISNGIGFNKFDAFAVIKE